MVVRSDDPIYPDVHDWLLATMTPEARRALVARSSYAQRAPGADVPGAVNDQAGIEQGPVDQRGDMPMEAA